MADEIKVPIVSTYDDGGAKDALADADKLEQSEPTVEVAAETTNARAALADIETVLDKIDAEKVTPEVDTAPAADGVKRLGSESDQTRSVMANMVGNTTQDLGALGGVAGSAGMAIGQLGEYATEGNVSMAGLASTAVPMAGLALVSAAASKAMQIFADRAKQSADDTKAWQKAMTDGGSAAANMATHLADVGKVMADVSDHTVNAAKVAGAAKDEFFHLGGVAKDMFDLFTGGFDSVKDLTESLGDAGVTVDQWTRAVAGGEAGAATFAAALAATNLSAGEQKELMAGLTNSQGDYEKASKNAAAAAKVFGDDGKAAAKKVEDAHDALAKAVAADVDAMSAKWDELRGTLDADEAILNLQTEFDELKVKGTEAFDAAKAGAADAEQKQRDYQIATINTKKSIFDLGEQIGLSLNQTTTLVAKVDKGELDAVERQIEILRRNNKINLEIVARGGAGYAGVIAGTPSMVNPSPPGGVTTVNINMPAGSRGVDVVRQVAGQTRRNGRRYGAAQVVNFARR